MAHRCANADIHKLIALGLDRGSDVDVFIIVVIILNFHTVVVGFGHAHFAPLVHSNQVFVAD